MQAKLLSDSLFHGRQITVIPKRKNLPGHGAGAFRGRGGMMNQIATMMMMMSRGGFRGRGGRGGGFKPRGGAPGPAPK